MRRAQVTLQEAKSPLLVNEGTAGMSEYMYPQNVSHCINKRCKIIYDNTFKLS